MKTLTPKVGAHLGMWKFIPSLSHTPENMKCDSQASFLACTFASLCLGCEPKARAMTNFICFLHSHNRFSLTCKHNSIQRKRLHIGIHHHYKSHTCQHFALGDFNIRIPNFKGSPNEGKQFLKSTSRKTIFVLSDKNTWLFTQMSS